MRWPMAFIVWIILFLTIFFSADYCLLESIAQELNDNALCEFYSLNWVKDCEIHF